MSIISVTGGDVEVMASSGVSKLGDRALHELIAERYEQDR